MRSKNSNQLLNSSSNRIEPDDAPAIPTFIDNNNPTVIIQNGNIHDSENPQQPIDISSIPLPMSNMTKPTIGVWSLAALTFFSVSGGPYGCESLVSSAGPLGAIIIVCIVPWIWALPMSLITAELASMMPEMGGYIVWIDRAFGQFWAYQNGLWKVSCNLIDNALYPNLFVYYLMDLTGDLNYETRLLVSFSLVSFVCICNVLGVDIVSDAASVFVVMTLLPFIVMVFVGLGRGEVSPSDWGSGRQDGLPVQLGTFFTIALWKTSGFDNVGACASEVKDPGKSFPKAMLISVVLVTMCYLFPIAVGVSYAKEYSQWADGYFVTVAKLTAGDEWLGVWVTVTGSLTALAMLNATLCTSARAIQSMAALGFFPKPLAHINSRFQTPDVAVIFNGIVVMIVLLPDLDFSEIANVSMWFYAWTIFILFGAFWKLRRHSPHMARPYRVPLEGWKLLCFVCVPPCLCCVLLVIFSGTLTWALGMAVVTTTMISWWPFQRWYGKKNTSMGSGMVITPGDISLSTITTTTTTTITSSSPSVSNVNYVQAI
jgi:amino acid transporter